MKVTSMREYLAAVPDVEDRSNVEAQSSNRPPKTGFLSGFADLAASARGLGVSVTLERVALRGEDFALLSLGERRRADRLICPQRRGVFVARRAALRRRLGQSLGCPAKNVRLAAGPGGAPWLDHAGAPPLSWAASGDWLALALGPFGYRLGIDVEFERSLPVGTMASLVAHPRESALLARLPHAARRRAFFRLWTLKEAILKADGRGLAAGAKRLCLPDEVIRGETSELSVSLDRTAYSCWTAFEAGLAVSLALSAD